MTFVAHLRKCLRTASSCHTQWDSVASQTFVLFENYTSISVLPSDFKQMLPRTTSVAMMLPRTTSMAMVVPRTTSMAKVFSHRISFL